MVKNIKISAQLIEYSLENSISKEFFFHSYLKSQRTSGVWKNIKSEKVLLANQLGVSESTIRRLIKSLCRLEMAQINDKGHLILKSMNKIGRDTKTHKGKHYKRVQKINIECSIKDVKEHFSLFSLEKHRGQQIFKIKDSYLSKINSKPSMELIRSGKLSQNEVKCLFGEHGLRSDKMIDDAGISRLGISKMIGKKNPMAGSRLIYNLFAKGLIKGDTERLERVGLGDKTRLDMMSSKFPNRCYFLKKGVIYRKRINILVFNNESLNSITWDKDTIN